MENNNKIVCFHLISDLSGAVAILTPDYTQHKDKSTSEMRSILAKEFKKWKVDNKKDKDNNCIESSYGILGYFQSYLKLEKAYKVDMRDVRVRPVYIPWDLAINFLGVPFNKIASEYEITRAVENLERLGIKQTDAK